MNTVRILMDEELLAGLDADEEVRIGIEHGLKNESAVYLDHVQTFDQSRLSGLIGRLDDEAMIEVCRAIAAAAGCPMSS